MSGTQPGRTAFDWQAAREALARAASALESSHRPSGEAARRILEERARRLARPPEAPAPDDQLTVVRFQLGRERYALELRYLREVARLTSIVPVPGTPDFVLGVTNLRGEILSVFDLRRLMGVAIAGLSDMGRVLVLGRDRPEFGVLADAVDGVGPLDPGALAAPPESVSERGRRYLLGLTRDALLALDGRALLDDRDLVLTAGEESTT